MEMMMFWRVCPMGVMRRNARQPASDLQPRPWRASALDLGSLVVAEALTMGKIIDRVYMGSGCQVTHKGVSSIPVTQFESGGIPKATFKPQWQPLHAGASWRHLISICVKRRGQVCLHVDEGTKDLSNRVFTNTFPGVVRDRRGRRSLGRGRRSGPRIVDSWRGSHGSRLEDLDAKQIQ